MAIAAADTAVSGGDERAAEDAASESGASPDVIAFAGIGAGEGAEAAQFVQEGNRVPTLGIDDVPTLGIDDVPTPGIDDEPTPGIDDEPTPGIDNGAQQDGDDGAQQDGDEAPPDSQPFS